VADKKVHVLYILTKLELGGAQKVCLSLLKGIKEKGNFGGLISGAEGVLVSQAQKYESVFFLKDLKREVGIKIFLRELKVFFQMISLIKSLKKKYPNLMIHTHSTKAGLMGRWAAFFAGVKRRIHTVHGFGFHEHQSKVVWFIIYLLEFLTSFITTKFICVSKVDLEYGKKLIPRFGKKAIIIRAAVEWDKFYIPAQRIKEKQDLFLAAKSDITNFEEKFVIGTISCFKPQKNLFDLLKAFKLLREELGEEKKKAVLLQIIGDGFLRDKVADWIKINNLVNNIELLGWQSDVSKWVHSWKIFALSSLWEGLPCAVVEARLTKIPVVAYDVGGIREVILENKNGFLIPPGKWRLLADKIKLLINDINLYEKMSLYQDDLLNFNDQRMIQKHLDLYKELSSF